MQFSLSTLALIAQAGISLGAAISKANQEAVAIPVSTPDSLLPTPTANRAVNRAENWASTHPQETLAPQLKAAVIDTDDFWSTYTDGSPAPVPFPFPFITTVDLPSHQSDGCGRFKSKEECEDFKRKHDLIM